MVLLFMAFNNWFCRALLRRCERAGNIPQPKNRWSQNATAIGSKRGRQQDIGEKNQNKIKSDFCFCFSFVVLGSVCLCVCLSVCGFLLIISLSLFLPLFIAFLRLAILQVAAIYANMQKSQFYLHYFLNKKSLARPRILYCC